MGKGKQDTPAAGVIIVAAGESRRMQGQDKILASLGGKPVLEWSIEAFQQYPLVHRIILVNSRHNIDQVKYMRIERQWSKVAEICLGGRRRQDSVAAGLKLLGTCDWVIIHDGARPLISREIIDRGMEAAKETGAAIAAVPVTDTIKTADMDMTVTGTLDRSRLWAVQTPQIFRFTLIEEAYRRASGDVTDDAALVEKIGGKIKIFMGSYDNIKITTPHDLAAAELWIKNNGQ
jgi:2-C-methyl-D-erythritol 4-phosphate cytidylyltransferase